MERFTESALRRTLTRFLADERGAHAVEFALIAFPLFLLVMGIIEFGLLMFTQMAVESALTNVARTTTIGNTGGYPDRVSYIEAELRRQTEGLIHGEDIIISSSVVDTAPSSYVEPELCLSNPPRLGPSCPAGTPFVDSNNNGVYDGGTLSSNYGGGGNLVQINVALPWSFFTPIIGQFFTPEHVVGQPAPGQELDGVYVIRASALVVNEPFGN